jgi:hypothetical protein
MPRLGRRPGAALGPRADEKGRELTGSDRKQIAYALDEAGQDASTELVGAAEQGRIQFRSRLLQPPYGGELRLLV